MPQTDAKDKPEATTETAATSPAAAPEPSETEIRLRLLELCGISSGSFRRPNAIIADANELYKFVRPERKGD